MKLILFALIALILFSCNFEFIKDEEPKENPPKAYLLNADFSFFSYPIQIYKTSYFFPRLNTIRTTDYVPEEARLFDSDKIESFSLIENKTNTIWEYTLIDSLIFEYFYEFRDSLNNKLKTVSEKNVSFKYKFVHKYYSDSLEFQLPKPTYILST